MAAPKLRLRFPDPDLKTPTHDALIGQFIDAHGPDWLVREIYGSDPVGALSPWATKYEIEAPITNKRQVIGYVDLAITANRTIECPLCQDLVRLEYSIGVGYKNYEERPYCPDHLVKVYPPWPPYYGRHQDPEGVAEAEHCDRCHVLRARECPAHKRSIWPEPWCQIHLGVEFKTQVSSVGELIRQIKTYQFYAPSKAFAAITYGICPHKNLLAREGIHVVEQINQEFQLYRPEL